MQRLIAVFAILCAISCSSDDNNGQNNGQNNGDNNGTNNAGADSGGDASPDTDATSEPDATDESDAPSSWCSLVDCTPEKPFCSDALEACVGCLTDNDCTQGTLRTCDNVAQGDETEPSYTCVECVDDTICAGGTCDLSTHTCGL